MTNEELEEQIIWLCELSDPTVSDLADLVRLSDEWERRFPLGPEPRF